MFSFFQSCDFIIKDSIVDNFITLDIISFVKLKGKKRFNVILPCLEKRNQQAPNWCMF